MELDLLLLAHQISMCKVEYLTVCASPPQGAVVGSRCGFPLSRLKSPAPQCPSGWGREGCRRRSLQQLMVRLLLFWAGLWPEHVGGLTLLSYNVRQR